MRRILPNVRSFVIELIRLLLSCMIPVKKGKVLFESVPDYSDNSRAFSDYILKHTNYCVLWSVTNAYKYQSNDRIRFIEKNGGTSLRGRLAFIYHTVSSQYLFSTHAAFLFANKRKQTYVCLWHGMPLKKIGALVDSANKYYINNAKYILSASKYYTPIFEKCFNRRTDDILPVGIPRNDWLFGDSKVLEKLEITVNQDEKLIVYLPTFRKKNVAEKGATDPNLFKEGLFDFSCDDVVRELDEQLRLLHIKLIIKPHPADKNQPRNQDYQNIKIIPHSIFDDNDVQLNQLLHYTDALLTDFSGVFIDYLNLDRPIGFVLTDLADYTEQRGFLFDKPLEYMPGAKIYNKEDFLSFCKDVFSEKDTFKAERKRLQPIYNDFTDDKNCERLALFLGLTLS